MDESIIKMNWQKGDAFTGCINPVPLRGYQRLIFPTFFHSPDQSTANGATVDRSILCPLRFWPSTAIFLWGWAVTMILIRVLRLPIIK